MLIGSVAFSNLQRYYTVPAYFCGILIDETDLTKLKGIRSKDCLEQEIKNNPFDLIQIEGEIEKYSPYLKKKIIVDAPTIDGKPNLMTKEGIDEVCKIVISKLIYQDLTILPENVKEVHLREGINFENQPIKIEINNQSSKLTDYFSDSNLKIITEKESNFSKIMELSRLLSWREYVNERRKNSLFATQFLKSNKDFKLSQFLRLLWPHSRIETYPNAFVGLPEIITKVNQQTSLSTFTLNKKISFFMFAKSCIGQFNQDSNLQICTKSKDLRCGILLASTSREDRCSGCRSAIDRLKFDSKSLAKLASTEDEDPLEGYSDASHYIYITRFGDKLKIGRARLVRGTSRLIEQSCSDALVIFPILSFNEADRVEHLIIDYLKNNLEKLEKFGIKNVSDKGFSSDKIAMIEKWYYDSLESNEIAYCNILELLKQNMELKTILEVTNQRIIDLKENWQFDKGFDFSNLSNDSVFWTKIEGHVKGIIGNLIFLEHKIIDLEKIQGWLFVGDGFN